MFEWYCHHTGQSKAFPIAIKRCLYLNRMHMFRLSSTVGSTRIQVGKFEDYMVYWRPSDYTVWVTNQNSGLINYDNAKAYDASEVMLTAIAMLKSQQGIQQ